VGHLVQPPCQSRVTYSRLHRALSRGVLNISREGDSTTSLGSLFQCSITLMTLSCLLISILLSTDNYFLVIYIFKEETKNTKVIQFSSCMGTRSDNEILSDLSFFQLSI